MEYTNFSLRVPSLACTRQSNKSALCLGFLFVLTAGLAWGRESDEFFDMPLGELLTLETTLVSKKSQPISQSAAAVFVITAEDIRRSGVTSIPESLRMVPGLQVARIDGNKWAISARGFNGRFANKLLVMIDGRSVYTPLFSGVYWDVQDTVLEDVERIEVIRGPGSTLWGANAVNGVINIVTRSAADTQGGLLSAGLGSQDKGTLSLRHGGALEDLGHYRVYGKFFDRGGNRIEATGEAADDSWRAGRAGFRMDLQTREAGSVTLQGDYYDGDSGESSDVDLVVPPYHVLEEHTQKVSGGNLLARWQRDVSEQTDFSLQGYYDRTRRDWRYIDETRDTLDLDFQLRTQHLSGHDLLFGLGYRYSADDTRGTSLGLVDPASRRDHLYSAFIQDDIELSPDTLTLTLGSKFEHNDYTGFEYQPNVRLLWNPDERQSLWVSASRAVSIPSRIYHDGEVAGDQNAPGEDGNPLPVPMAVRLMGDRRVEAERLMAYELGYRVQPVDTLNLDFALYYNDYGKLISARLNAPACQPGGDAFPLCLFLPPTPSHVEQPVTADSVTSGHSYGFEMAADWRMHYQWRLQAAYTHQQMHLSTPEGSTPFYLEGSNPRHQLSLRVSYDPRSDIDLDLWGRYVDELPEMLGSSSKRIDSYLELDLRIAWRPQRDLELSVTGRNLLDSRHAEYFSDLSDLPLIGIERSVFGKLEWRF